MHIHLFIAFILLDVRKCQRLEVPVDHDRITKGKEEFEKIFRKTSHSECWNKALSKLDVGCKEMNDIEQSFLALQFANCHLEKSGLETYDCQSDNFKVCSKKMSSNVIAFTTYTEFFTHVSDICFYLQSDIWRQKTEETIFRLSETSKESLDVLSKSIVKQEQVLSSQQQSLQNQKEILVNENILKETLLTSAESAKDVFKEVQEHAQQQKTMFSETFDHIFESVERLANLQTMLLGEFIGLQSIAFYFVAIIVCYLFTSTPRTCTARLPLFIGLTLLIITERMYVEWRVSFTNKTFTTEQIHDQIWTLRKCFLSLAIIGLGICIARYKDFNKINYSILQDIQVQILELRKIQESHTGNEVLDTTDAGGDSTLKPDTVGIQEATRQLEMSIQAITASTPQKNAGFIFPLVECNVKKANQRNNKKSRGEFSDCDDVTIDHKPAKKKSRRSTANVLSNTMNSSAKLNESHYNLRSRRSSTSFNLSDVNKSLANRTVVNVQKANHPKKKRKNKPAFFSSDEEC